MLILFTVHHYPAVRTDCGFVFMTAVETFDHSASVETFCDWPAAVLAPRLLSATAR